MNTVENTNINIYTKINELQRILMEYLEYELDPDDDCKSRELLNKVKTTQTEYDLGCVDLLLQYSQHEKGTPENSLYYNKYMNYISSNNILNIINDVYSYCQFLRTKYVVDDNTIDDSFANFNLTSVNIPHGVRSNDICECGTQMVVESVNSEMICPSCGVSRKLFGVVFDDDQLYFQEGNRTKHGKYDPTKHCRFWVDRIQAKENISIPSDVISKVKKCIRNNRIRKDQVTCPIIRGLLKQLKLTSYNDNVPLICKLITGKEPDQLTDNELKLTYMYFALVIQIYNTVKPDNKPNCPYHPFFIYKILEQLLKDQPTRKNKILSCIHLQSRETLIENDRIWKLICEEISEFEYVPTDGSV